MNRTVSSVSKDTPNKNAEKAKSELSTKYNMKRGKDSGIKIRLKPLSVGDRVRFQKKGAKDKVMHKAYHADLWSKKAYLVTSKRGNRYIVNGKLYHRDNLRLTEEYDEESEYLVYHRKKIRQKETRLEELKRKKEAEKKVAKPKKTSKHKIPKKYKMRPKSEISKKQQVKRAVIPKKKIPKKK